MKKVLQTAEMALWLDSYDDVFSDFDPRPFAERSLSDDFLIEMKKVVKDRGRDSFELKFLLAPESRDEKDESTIKERLHHFFNQQYQQFLKERKKVIQRGIFFVVLGILLMFCASLLATFWSGYLLLSNFLIILLEPAGWFLFWEGLARAMYRAEEINPEIKFYHKMARSKVSFISY
jgi:hypothetical protein